MVSVFVIATSAHSVIATFNEIHFKKMVMKIKNFQISIHYMLHKKLFLKQMFYIPQLENSKFRIFLLSINSTSVQIKSSNQP